MAKSPSRAAPARSFAHLFGLGPKAAKAEDNKDDAKAKGARAEQEADVVDDGAAQCPECDGTGKDDDGDTCQACGGSGEVGDGDETSKARGAKGAKAAKSDEDEDEDEDKDDAKAKAAAAKATKAECTRWTTVMSHENSGQGRVGAAARMLAESRLPASAIISTLGELPTASAAGGKESLYSRMNGDSRPKNPGAGGGAAAPPADDFAAQMSAAVGKVRPKASK